MLEIKDLTVTFSGGGVAIQSFDLTVPKGKRTAVIGESGSGKSVMLCAILGILPSSASVSGSILLDNKNLLDCSEKEMTRLRGTRFSYIPQSGGTSMNPLLTVGYQIGEPLIEKMGVNKKTAISDAVKWLKRLHLGDEERLAKAYPHTLSGGMRQRALIAMGSISGAPLLLADEPTKGLDGDRVEVVTELFQELCDRTLLCVSHDLHFVEAIADYVCVMYASQAVEYCSSGEFFENPLHPYSRLTLEALPENGLKVSSGFAPARQAFSELGCHFYDRCPCRTKQCCTAPPMAEVSGRKVRCWKYAH